MQNNVNTVAEKVEKDGEHAADLDQALAVAGKPLNTILKIL